MRAWASRIGLGALLALMAGLVGCMTNPSSVTLSGPPGPYIIGEMTPTLTATGNPGSSAGLWTYSFDADPACGTFNPATIGPTDQTTSSTQFTPTTQTSNCTLSVTLTTASGKTATASISRDVAARPTVFGTVPANGATNVAVTTDITVTFSQAMDPATVVLTCTGETSGACNMTISTPTTPDNITFTWTVGDPNAADPNELEYNETYSMRVNGSSALGVAMAAPHDWSFTTAAAPPPPAAACPINDINEVEPNDTFASPQVINLTPGNGTGWVDGSINPATDVDYYQITLTAESLVFAYVRTDFDIRTGASTDSVLIIGGPFDTTTSCPDTGTWNECDDDHGGQAGLSSSISGLRLAAGSYTIGVRHYSSSFPSTIIPYRLYIAVVPTANITYVSGPGPHAVTTCPQVFDNTGDLTKHLYNVDIPDGDEVLWADADLNPDCQPASKRETTCTGWDAELTLYTPVPSAVAWPELTGQCDSSVSLSSPQESCSVDPNLDPVGDDSWSLTGTWQVEVCEWGSGFPACDPIPTGARYRILIVVW